VAKNVKGTFIACIVIEEKYKWGSQQIIETVIK
jgi:hypothetical protein